jgi:aryl-alcohol dehydrogenase-like predicted oxidoreductase
VERVLGRSGIVVSALGLGTARVGGLGYSRAGDRETRLDPAAVDESKRAIRAAIDRGVTLIDTADIYGAGRAERLVGEAIRDVRNKVAIATKFGELFDEETGVKPEQAVTPEYVRQACDASLRRLRIGTIDVYFFHLRDFPLDQAVGIRDALEDLVARGKIRAYGWSTDDVERARLFAQGPHCTAIEHRLNIFDDASDMIRLCGELKLGEIIRAPLLTGVLTGRWHRGDLLPDSDRRSDGFADERFLRMLDRAESLRPMLTQDGRTYVQGALAWIWTRSVLAVPVPGFRTVAQAEELALAMRHGPLSPEAFGRVAEAMKAPL